MAFLTPLKLPSPVEVDEEKLIYSPSPYRSPASTIITPRLNARRGSNPETPSTALLSRLVSRRLSIPASVSYSGGWESSRLPTNILHSIFMFMNFESAVEVTDMELVCRQFKKALDLKHIAVQKIWRRLLVAKWGSDLLTAEEQKQHLNPKHIYERRFLKCILPVRMAEKELAVLLKAGKFSFELEAKVSLKKYAAQREHGRLLLMGALEDAGDPRAVALEAMKKASSSDATGHLQLINALYRDDDLSEILRAVTTFRQMLSSLDNPNIELVVNAGIVPRFVELLMNRARESHTLRFELMWVLTNICSGESQHVKRVVDAGAIPLLVDALRDSELNVDDIVVEQAVWALGNISGDNAKYNDLVMSHEPLSALLPRVFAVPDVLTLRTSFIRNLAWFLSNCVRARPKQPFWKVQRIVDLYSLTVLHLDVDVLSDSLWGLSYAAGECTEDEAMYILEKIPTLHIVRLLGHPSAMVTSPLLNVVVNLSKASGKAAKHLLGAGVAERLEALLKRHGARPRVVSGTRNFALAVVAHLGSDVLKLIPALNVFLSLRALDSEAPSE